MRMSVAFVILVFLFSLYSRRSLKKVFGSPPKLGLWAGLLLSANYFGYMKGVELTSAANTQIMIQLGPLMFLFVGVAYFKEELRKVQWIGVFLAFFGFSLFNWDQVILSFENKDVYFQGNLWIVMAAATWAIYAGFQKVLMSRGWKPQELNLLIYTIATLVLLPLITPSEFLALSAFEWFVLFLLGLNTLIAYGAFVEAVKRAPASYVSLIISVNPLLTLIILHLLDKFELHFIDPEPINLMGYAGALLVIGGVTIAVSLRKRRPRALPSPNAP